MAGSMVTAFTTTVVGLACGMAAYLMSMVREKWVKADMRGDGVYDGANAPQFKNSKLGEENEIYEEA